ncbi:hypothetical protein MHF_1169 [Mycoplasma haemofelis Ohio2]|uniref:Uncharacterized protein n=1 Tax=Mycoplasma haemofelis (strain Ohio2) TaxID=859194 RepID=F6FJQ5_MYCHI|nr:hypothetical protein MHF_1169 [Mycoplasma haemofelis Ohio2]
MALGKVLFLGTATASVGGGIGMAAGNLMSSSPKEEKVKSAEIPPTPKDTVDVVEPKPKKCFIYVAGEVTDTNQSITFTKILEKFEGADAFLQQKSIQEGNFKNDVVGACSGSKSTVVKTEEGFNVYVYQKSDTGKTWNYTERMQKKDWVKEQSIINNSKSVLGIS